jgi:murein DD-endopeptidase MepM/ murein hydrolase activator NlpD
MAPPKYTTIMLVPDGTEPRSGWRVRTWVMKLVVTSIIVILVGIVLFFSFYGKVLSRAAMTEQVAKENEDLRRYYYKVQLLEQNLNQAREVVTRMTQLAGIDYEFPDFPDDSTIFAHLDRTTEAVIARPPSGDWSLPAGLPIRGFMTQGFKVTDANNYHPGIDIACAVGTPVLATGSGIVELVDYDSVYGHMVVIKHNDSVSTVYAHNKEILVNVGQNVPVGARIASSGNSGKSTAPHLHYEIRANGEPINPLDNPYEEN